GQPNEVAEVRVGDDGRIDLMVGTHSNGQGHETTFAQIAADAFGLPLARFRFRQGDTDDLDAGGGHGGARSMHQGGTALLMAAEASSRMRGGLPPACCRPAWRRFSTKPACCAWLRPDRR